MGKITDINKNRPKEVDLYYELINAVQQKFEEESRHETALRYILNAERANSDPQSSKDDSEAV